ncbi:MAG: hypothetical protein E7255_11705 [Lachnospiraceae bacterium]|nr:hypothetical protein [Lachnospiraceae bacterium]
MAKLVGMKVTTRQDGTKGYLYNFADSFSDYDKEHAECRGSQVFSEYSTKAFDVNVGDEVDVIYTKGFQNKAVLMDILVVSENKIKINNK